jgi:hypothetical protein
MIIDNNLILDNPQYEIKGIFLNSKVTVTIYLEGIKYARVLGHFAIDGTKTFQDGLSTDLYNVFNDVTLASLNIAELDKYVLPQLYPYAVEIPTEYRWVFPQDKFILNGFEIPLDTYQKTKVVNLAYFEWIEFRAELDRTDEEGNFVYATLKRSLMELWDYVALQVTNNNIIVL